MEANRESYWIIVAGFVSPTNGSGLRRMYETRILTANNSETKQRQRQRIFDNAYGNTLEPSKVPQHASSLASVLWRRVDPLPASRRRAGAPQPPAAARRPEKILDKRLVEVREQAISK